MAFQEKVGRGVDCRERIVAFIPEYAAYLMNRLKKGEDGKVAFERARGKVPSVLGVEFGEKVLLWRGHGAKMEKILPRWSHGIFVGVKRKSGELMLARPEGVHFARSARRVPLDQRWGEDNVNWVCWAPWRRYKDAPDGDGEVPDGGAG